MSNNYWLIAVPGNKSKEASFRQLSEKVGPSSGLTNSLSPFNVPNDMKVGTLDSLVALSDDLIKLDPMVEGVVKKIASLLHELLKDHQDKIPDSLTAEGMNVHDYIREFQWDVRKYSVKASTRDIINDIMTKINDMDSDLKHKQASYTLIKNNLSTIERNESGSLLSRSLVGIVERKDVIEGSEYLQTVFVCVPKALSKDFQDCYERLTDMVVPRSGNKIAEDADYELWGVTMLKRVIEDYKREARSRKFIVRDHTFDSMAAQNLCIEKKEMEVDLKKQWSSLVRWGKTSFSEIFTSWMHVKAVRIFVESVLCYGLPPNFQAATIRPIHKKQKQLRQVLQDMYGYLENRRGVLSDGKAGNDFEIPAGMGGNLEDFHPYVSFSFDLSFLNVEKKR